MLTLLDKLAGWYLDWRVSAAAKRNPDLAQFRKLNATPDTLEAEFFAPGIAILADEAAAMLKAHGAENYVVFDMLPRVDRGLRPVRVTVQWAYGLSPAQKNTKLEAELAHLREEVNHNAVLARKEQRRAACFLTALQEIAYPQGWQEDGGSLSSYLQETARRVLETR